MGSSFWELSFWTANETQTKAEPNGPNTKSVKFQHCTSEWGVYRIEVKKLLYQPHAVTHALLDFSRI